MVKDATPATNISVSFFGISKGRCSQIINNLSEKGYIKIDYDREGKQVKKRTMKVVRKLTTPYLENYRPYLENDKENNTSSNTSNNDQSDRKVSEKQLDEDFNKLWKLYPRKEGKKKAFEAYKRAIKKGTTNKEIQTGIVNYLTQIKVQGTAKQYIKQGSTWFNGECWDDEYNLGESQAPVNPKEKTGDAPRPRSREEEELEARKQSAEAFLYNLREHPEYFEIEHMKAAINDFVTKNPQLQEEVLEIARTRGKSDRNTA